MSHISRFILSIGLIVILSATLRNASTDLPVDSDLPESIRLSFVVKDIHVADSLASHGAALAALERYRAVEETLKVSLGPDEDALGWLWLRIVRSLAQSDQPMAAAMQLDSILVRMPDSRWAAKAHQDKGDMLIKAEYYREAVAHFLSAVEHSEGTEAGHLAFRIAYCYQQIEQWNEAVTWYDRSRRTYPVLGDYALFFAAQCLQILNRPDDAFVRLRLLLREYPHSSFLTDVTVLTGDAMIADNRYDEAIAEARSHLLADHFLTPSDIAEMLAQIGAAYEAASRPDSALATYRTVLEQYRTTERAISVLEAFQAIKNRREEGLTDEEQLWGGLVYLNHREYGKAIQVLQRLSRSSSDSSILPEAEYYLGRSQYLSRQYSTAEQGFRRFVEKYPDHELAASASFHIARCIRARKGSSRSIDAYMAFVEAYPDASMAPDALLFIAQRLEAAGRLTDAAKHYQRLATENPDYKDADKARWQEGYCHYHLRRYGRAAEVFQQLAQEFPGSSLAPKALYWSGKAGQKAKQPTDAGVRYSELIKAYPASYYAYQAGTRLNDMEGKPVSSPLRGWRQAVDHDIAPPVMDLEAFTERFLLSTSKPGNTEAWIHLGRARELFRVGLRTEGVEEVEMVRRAYPDDEAVLAQVTRLYFEHRYYREGIRAANALQRYLVKQKRTTTVPIQLLYPAPFWTHIREEAEKLDLDPLFLLAIMRQESRFDRWITSWAGARGLMQLMPSTAKQLAKQMRLKNYSARRLYEPEISIPVGSQYFAQLMKRFNGKPELALAAYNGGPTRVARWVRQRGASDIDEFTERIGIHETRNFVKAVMDNYARYTLFLGAGHSYRDPASLAQ